MWPSPLVVSHQPHRVCAQTSASLAVASGGGADGRATADGGAALAAGGGATRRAARPPRWPSDGAATAADAPSSDGRPAAAVRMDVVIAAAIGDGVAGRADGRLFRCWVCRAAHRLIGVCRRRRWCCCRNRPVCKRFGVSARPAGISDREWHRCR